jgi:hypothetical protein
MFAAEDCALVAFQISGSMSSDNRNWTIQGDLQCAASMLFFIRTTRNLCVRSAFDATRSRRR